MKKEIKGLRKLSTEEMEKVNGGWYINVLDCNTGGFFLDAAIASKNWDAYGNLMVLYVNTMGCQYA